MIKLPIYKIIPKLSSFTAISIVDDPAIEELFMAFEKEELSFKFSDDDKRIISGPAMIPNKLIYRNEPPCYVMYDESGIVEFAKQFFKSGSKFNLMHSENQVEVEIFESYFLKENNEWNLPIGTWIVSAKVEDESVWSDIKNGSFKGFSIQSLFTGEMIEEFTKNNNKKEIMMEEFKEVLNQLLFKVEAIENKFNEKEIVQAADPILDENGNPVEQPVVDTPDETVANLENKVSELEAKLAKFMEDCELRIQSIEEKSNATDVAIEEFSKQKVDVTEIEKVETFSKVSDESPMSQYFK